MTPEEHIAEAERLLDDATRDYDNPDHFMQQQQGAAIWLAAAQVHIGLANWKKEA